MLKASLTRSWKRKDWPAVLKILFGWGCNHLLFFTMLFFFLFYGCEIFEPNLESAVDTRRRLGKVDGRFPHWVAPFTGERYSCVFYATWGDTVPQTTAVFEDKLGEEDHGKKRKLEEPA